MNIRIQNPESRRFLKKIFFYSECWILDSIISLCPTKKSATEQGVGIEL